MKVFALTLVPFVWTASLMAGAQAEGSFDRSLAVSGPVDLDVKTDSGGITVTPGSSGTLRVHAILKGQHGWFDSSDVESRIRELERNPPVEQSGNRVRIGYVHDRDLLKNVSMRLEIQTPSDTQLRAHADSGGIRVEGIRGPADCHTDSGGIEIRNIASEVRAAADSGSIHLSNINGPVSAHVDSGGIEATGVSGSIEARTDSGGIRLAQTNPAPIHAKADSGGITVKLAPGGGYDLSIEAESGHISVPEMVVSSGFSRHHVEGKIHNGGPQVTIRADSGSITVE
ncbi:MAG: DUF4097 family beta strand repeat protein [Acidobacteriaceae bacterium]|nr:DUF4097 family beta strand repeat protein [Acidobacteriaceae bacterium]